MNLSIPVASYATTDIGSNTNKRDVSDMLDLWAHRETPLLNRVMWGADSGGLIIEWVSEHLGWGYVECSAAIGTGGTTFLIASGSGSGLSQAEQTKQIRVGTLLYAKGVANSGTLSGDHAWLAVSTIGASYTITVAFLGSTTASVAASSKLYIVGAFANEGSEPDRDTSRVRSLLSNKFTILRQDIDITGSQQATDMYAIGSEVPHQTAMRLLELQRDREMSVLFGKAQARTATAAGLMAGVFDFFVENQSYAWVDITTTSLSKSDVNNLVAEIAENGGRPNVIVGPLAQIRKFTQWDESRIRSRPDNRVGGEWITSFLTDSGIELDLIWIPKVPANFLAVLDLNKLELRAKRGRKLLLEKLGKKGDYDQWQLISEYSLEFRGYDKGHHGGFLSLS